MWTCLAGTKGKHSAKAIASIRFDLPKKYNLAGRSLNDFSFLSNFNTNLPDPLGPITDAKSVKGPIL